MKVPGLEMQVYLKVLGEGEMRGIVFETTVPWLCTKSGRGECLFNLVRPDGIFGEKALETEG